MAMMSRNFGIFLVVVVALWAVAQAVIVALGYGDSDGNKIVAYTTFGVAPIATIIALWLLNKGGN